MSEIAENKKKILKEIITQLHAGVPPQQVKERFKQFLGSISSEEIAKIENELVKEGMPREEIQRLCDVHLAVFREQLEKQKPEIPPEHPIGILLEEHKIMLQLAEKLASVTNKIKQINDKNYIGDAIHQLQHIARDFTDSEKHYLREENVLFPVIEKHGITEPPAIMWMEHNQIREKKKQLSNLIGKYDNIDFQDFKKQLAEASAALNEILPSHFFKENNILFPTALKVVTKEEWTDIRREFDEIGYCCFTPPHIIVAPKSEETKKEEALTQEGIVQFETGSLSKDEIEAILNTLPIDISFVDANDAVKYFNKAEKRIFVRTKAVIGRKVQLCHPQKSVHIVNKILEAFKTGKRDVAEFWITMNNRLIHIRYFAVRDQNGKYLGTMEVTQDLTELKKIEGEKRLLDWKE
ncbi:MAG: DUF438 domain-containing protein [Candidatus Bathyarchaeota archaeon]|jgi:PAS domain S-box-containing protein|nr:DUF438 domain-containing protein [Candidatus Bathyarchaeota archaeon A05DMB-5]MDH7557020.1 DUF438 domain-containing protein [Candidatus Bathyarchaeota archaeon]